MLSCDWLDFAVKLLMLLSNVGDGTKHLSRASQFCFGRSLGLKTKPPHPKKVLIFTTFWEITFTLNSMTIFYLINNKVKSLNLVKI